MLHPHKGEPHKMKSLSEEPRNETQIYNAHKHTHEIFNLIEKLKSHEASTDGILRDVIVGSIYSMCNSSI